MRPSHSLERRLKFLLAAVALGALGGLSRPARADLLPTCDQPSSLITCAAADVGKACQGGGMCYAMPCAAAGSGTTSMVYKCDACPTVLPPPDGGCSPGNLGTACGDGGTCSGIGSYCGATGKFVCSIPAASQPTGPPAGETDGGGAGGGAGSGAGGGTGGGAGSGAGGGAGSGTGGGAGSGTGGGAGSGTNSNGGGCDVNYGAPTAGVIAIALVAIGMVFLVIGRRRRSR